MFSKGRRSFRRILFEPLEDDRTVDASEQFPVTSLLSIVREDLEILDREIEIFVPDQSRRVQYLGLVHRIRHVEEIDQVVQDNHQCGQHMALSALLSNPNQRCRVLQRDDVIDPFYRQSQIRQPQRGFPILRGQLVFRLPLLHDSRYRGQFFDHCKRG